jgi:uncharacterized protein
MQRKAVVLRILVDRLSESPQRLESIEPAAWLRAGLGLTDDAEGAVHEDLRISVEAYRMGEDLFVAGEATGAVELACSRCLTRYRQPIRERFRLVLEPAGARVPADPEGAASLARDGVYLGDELESGWFQGSEIQLDRLVLEQISLGLPVQPLCREDCRGLCPRCGVDRNVESCSCAPVRSPSPFAVLAGLRVAQDTGGKTGGES